MMFRHSRLSLVVVALAVCAAWTLQPAGASAQAPACIESPLPADIDQGALSQSVFDQFSWQTFLAMAQNPTPSVPGAVAPMWSSWSSTADLLDQGPNPGLSGSRYYPKECKKVLNFKNYRMLDMVGKVDDDFLEATTRGLSSHPVVARNGTFLRYEILLSPATYTWIVEHRFNRASTLDGLTQPLNTMCGDASYTGGDPANPKMGALILKLAWMHLENFDQSTFFTEDLLVYAPSYDNSTSQASCQLMTMGLVGMHIIHKTLKQPTWIWSTFEHNLNAPDCLGLPWHQNTNGSRGPNQQCPAVTTDYNFYPQACASGSACQSCNLGPTTNGNGTCINPTTQDPNSAWCLDQPPNPNRGMSRLCRQVSGSQYYPEAARMNAACQNALGNHVLSNYQLISTQWFAKDFSRGGCQSVADTLSKWEAVRWPNPRMKFVQQQRSRMRPLVPLNPCHPVPYLANTSMESYERSNCMGCHSKSTVREDRTKPRLDFMYFLGLEVPVAPQ